MPRRGVVLGIAVLIATALVAIVITYNLSRQPSLSTNSSSSSSKQVLGAVSANDLTITNEISSMVDNHNGTLTITYTYVIKNLSNYTIYDVHATSRFNHSTPGLFTVTSLTGDSGLTLNSHYNGMSDVNLLSGANSLAAHSTKVLKLTILLNYTPALDPFINYVDVSGQTAGASSSSSSQASSPAPSSSSTQPSSSSSAGSTPVGSSSSSVSVPPVTTSMDPGSSSSSSSAGDVLGLFAQAQVTFSFPVGGAPSDIYIGKGN